MRQAQYGGAGNEEEEKVLAAKEFLRFEMKFDSETIDRMEVEKVFLPAKGDPQCLYVTFKHVASVSKIFEKTRYMRKESRIISCIPKECHARICAMRDLGKSLKENEKCHWRVKMGLRDLQLNRKDRSTGSWILVPIPETFPQVELRSSPDSFGSNSPAPGRPNQERWYKRTRESSGSSSDQNTPKVARKVDEADHEEENESETVDKRNSKSLEQMRIGRENAWREEIERANLVSDGPLNPEDDEDGLQKQLDVGVITSICGTPLKAVSTQDNHTQSPVFTNSIRRSKLAN